MTIAILCPTRGRPEQFRHMAASAGNNVIYAAYSDWDREFINGAGWVNWHGMPDNLPTAQKWNNLATLAMQSDAKLFMLGSDDMYFDTPGWDKALLDHYAALENKIHVYALQDSRDENGTPHIIATREYIEAMGYFVPPIFLHWHVDGWTVEIAKTNGCFTHMKDYMLVHDKPSDKGQGDDTHNRIRAWGWRARDAYVAQTMAHVLEGEKRRLSVAMNTGASAK